MSDDCDHDRYVGEMKVCFYCWEDEKRELEAARKVVEAAREHVYDIGSNTLRTQRLFDEALVAYDVAIKGRP